MIKLFQKVSVFYASRFEAAVKAMREASKETWAEKLPAEEKNLLQNLYRQATLDNMKQKMSQDRGTSPNFDSPMTAFRSTVGTETAQGMTEAQVWKSQFKHTHQKREDPAQNKTFFNENPQNPVNVGKTQTQATQSLAKGSKVDISDQKPLMQRSSMGKGIDQTLATQNLAKGSKVDMANLKPIQKEDIFKSPAQKGSQEGYGNRTGFQSGQQKDMQQGQKKSNKSKEDYESEYVNLARSILEKNKAHKYIKDF